VLNDILVDIGEAGPQNNEQSDQADSDENHQQRIFNQPLPIIQAGPAPE